MELKALEERINDRMDQRFIDNEKLSTAQHQNIIDKIDRFSERVSCVEKSSEEFQTFKKYGTGITSFILFIAAIYIFFI